MATLNRRMSNVIHTLFARMLSIRAAQTSVLVSCRCAANSLINSVPPRRYYSKKDERRKEIYEEIRRGYFHDLAEFKKSGGKQSIASQSLIPVNRSVPFPDLAVQSLSGRTANLQAELSGKVTLLISCLRASGQAMFDLYRLPFMEEFQSCQEVSCLQLNIVNQPVMRWFSSMINRSLQKQIPQDQHENFLCHFGPATNQQRRLFGNALVAHAFLCDTAGRMRWMSHAKPTQEEMDSLIKLTKQLIKSAG